MNGGESPISGFDARGTIGPGRAAGRVGVVVIGRNEGERLRRCLLSVIGQAEHVVYVDSGSTDGSAAVAANHGASVVDLDMDRPFTAGRARNAGYRRLTQLVPGIAYVQFIDGDCELVGGWLDAAAGFLDAHVRVAVIAGRLRERAPHSSIYNMLCEMEWKKDPGEAKASGGVAMIRRVAFDEAGGFRTELIAGEEPELCLRLRISGWSVWFLDRDMALHDAAMTRFSQWWKRSLRGGYAYAEGAFLHGARPERHFVRESRRAWLWGVWLPLIILAASLVDWRFSALGLAYPAQVLRIALRGDVSSRANWLRSLFLVLARFPEGVGQIKFQLLRGLGRRAALIEYK